MYDNSKIVKNFKIKFLEMRFFIGMNFFFIKVQCLNYSLAKSVLAKIFFLGKIGFSISIVLKFTLFPEMK